MLKELQPHSISFGGYGLTQNAARWIGNEFGHAPDPNWSTGLEGGGDPNSPFFVPAECDTTLQQFDRWFWVRISSGQKLSSIISCIFAELESLYASSYSS